MKRNKYIIFILPIFIIIFMMTILIGYSAWIISESTAISTHEETTLIDENMNDIDKSFVYNGQSQVPHKSNDTPSEVDDYIYNYCNIIKYYDSNGDSIGSGYNCNTIIDAGEYTATYYSSQTHIITTVDFKIEKAKPIIPEYYQICYYDKNASFDISKIIPLGVDGNPIDGEWVYKGGNAQTVSNEVGEQDKHYSTFTYYFDSNDPNYYDSENIDFMLYYYSIAYVGSGGKSYYCNLNTAIDAANSGTTKDVFVIPGLKENDNTYAIQITDTITINSDVSLTLPHTGEDWFTSDVGDLSNTIIDSNATNVKTYRQCLIELHNEADIVISKGGVLYIGGEFKASGISRYYSEINLDEGSSIYVEGELYCYGYIKENANNARNASQTDYLDRFDNAYDEGRFLKVSSSGKVVTAFASYDLASLGGGKLKGLIDLGICPVNIFDFPNIQTFFEVEAGGTLNAHTYMEVAGIALDEEIEVVGNSLSSAIFKLISGSLSVHYCPNNVLYTNSSNSFTNISLNGTLDQGYLYLNIQNMYEISTQNNYLPISYKLNVNIEKGSKYNLNYKIKFLPGSSFKIEEGATVNMNNSLILYKSDSFSSVIGVNYPSKPDSICINNGLLNIGSNGSVGGLIQTTNENGSAKVDFSSIDSSGLQSSSPEGHPTLTNIVLPAEGYFYNKVTLTPELRQYVARTFVESSTDNIGCWDGDSYILNTLEIQIDTSEDYAYNVYDYVVTTYSDQNGSDANELTQSSIYNIQNGQYFSITTSRNKSAHFSNPDINFVSGQIYEMQSNMTLIIVPNEGVKISYSSTSISGAGNSTYTFYESPGASSTNRISLGTLPTNSNFIIIKGYYLYFEFSGSYGTSGQVNFKSGTISPELNTGSSLTTKKYYLIDGNSSSDYKATFTLSANWCLTGDTLITLVDGSQKRINELQGDEQLLVWNHSTGEFESSSISILVEHNKDDVTQNILSLKFSNNTELNIIAKHGLFNATLNKYVDISIENIEDYIGHEFIVLDNLSLTKTKLISYECKFESTRAWGITTDKTITCFANGILQANPFNTGVLNAFEIDSDTFKYINVQEDIDTYGLFTYDDFKEYMTPYEFEALKFKYFKISLAKGHITYEEVLFILNYLNEHEDELYYPLI